MMYKLSDRFFSDDHAGVALVTGIALPVILSAAVFGTEAGAWALRHQALQGAADAGAISGVVSKASGSRLTTEVRAVAAVQGLLDGSNGIAVTVNAPPLSGNYKTTTGAVEVLISEPRQPVLAKFWTTNTFTISARAVAIPNPAGACMLALNSTASGAITIQGSAQVILKGCDAITNSNSGTALTAGGSSLLQVNKASAVGTIPISGNIAATGGIFSASPSATDPYAAQNFQTPPSSCTQSYSGGNVTLQPGVYCSGIALTAGANVTMAPGIYYLDSSDLKVAGNAKLSGSGVTIVFTASKGKNYASASIASNAIINLSAPPSGPTAGIVLFGDRAMPQGTSFKLTGGGTQNWTGAIYLPRADLTYAGGAGGGAGCTQIVADTITFTGNSNLSLSCSGAGVSAMGQQVALLVE